MKVKNLLETKNNEVVSIESSYSVEDAIRLMHKKKISALMVLREGRMAGIFTERDVVRCYVSKDGKKKFREIQVGDAMTKDLIVAEQHHEISDVMSIMVEKNIRHLPVIEAGNLIGMLSIRDIIQTQVGNLTSEIHYLKDYITGV